MMEFRTELIPAVSASPIGLKEKIFTIGSCFAQAMGSHLAENKFKVWNNQFGAVYNPTSIHRLLLFALGNELPPIGSYLQQEPGWLNYYYHSSFSAMKKEGLEDKIRTSLIEANDSIKNANRIIVTYGTAFVYRLKDSLQVVANCHKVPSTNFVKSLLTEPEIVASFQIFYSKLKSTNPNCKIILTVSPVRHLKDTLELNSVSKSILRISCHSIVDQFTDVEYFPAYEILLDDLRDYRFYKTDRLHPTEEAVLYIWEKFVAAYLDKSAREFIENWKEIQKDLAHQPFHPESQNHQRFLKATIKKLERLASLVDVKNEIENLKSRIAASQNSASSNP